MPAVADLVPLPWMTVVVLLSLRLGAMLLATPLLSSTGVPVRVRVLLVVGLAAALSFALGLQPTGAAMEALGRDIAAHPGRLVHAALTEVALGTTMALAIHAGFAAFSIAGNLLDVQLGFGLARVFDPVTGASAPLVTAALERVAVLAFFLLDGHHALLRAFAWSLERVPLGAAWDPRATVGALLPQVAALLAMSVSLAAPIVFALLMTELVLGLIARNLPQINILTLGLVVKVFLALGLLGAWFVTLGPAMDRVYRGIAQALSAALPPSPHLSGTGLLQGTH